jgi:CHAT domain-containing protein
MLGSLPFDLLLSDSVASSKRNYQSLPYLIKGFSISYINSSSIFVEDAHKTTARPSATYPFIGFAPSYQTPANPSPEMSRSHALARLTHNLTEVQNAAEIMGGKYFSNSQADEPQFYDIAPRAAILHLAMHAFVNDTNPLLSGLAFGHLQTNEKSHQDNYLYAYELYNLTLPTQLSVLSACNTGLGKWVQGEGMMNIARGFRYAGCNSIIYSLWQIDDESTANLMHTLYVHLKEGQTKDQALRKAKLTFLANADPVTSHPYYWGALNLIGSSAPLDMEDHPNNLWLWGLMIFLLLGVSVYFIRSRRSSIFSR